VHFAHLGVLGNLEQDEKDGAVLATIDSVSSQADKGQKH